MWTVTAVGRKLKVLQFSIPEMPLADCNNVHFSQELRGHSTQSQNYTPEPALVPIRVMVWWAVPAAHRSPLTLPVCWCLSFVSFSAVTAWDGTVTLTALVFSIISAVDPFRLTRQSRETSLLEWNNTQTVQINLSILKEVPWLQLPLTSTYQSSPINSLPEISASDLNPCRACVKLHQGANWISRTRVQRLRAGVTLQTGSSYHKDIFPWQISTLQPFQHKQH